MRLVQGEYEQCISYCVKMLKSDFFEFDFTYVPMSENFRELNRFLWESRHQCTRFRNFYEGRVVIDVTEWNRHFPNDYFDAFLYFLKSNEGCLSCTMISSEPFSSAVLDRINRLFKAKTTVLSEKETKRKPKQSIGFAANKDEMEENRNV